MLTLNYHPPPRLAHLEPVFIWDGVIPELKMQTVLTRRLSLAAMNSAFMRSSPSTRASKRFQAECYSLPPLFIDCVQTVLRSLGVEMIAVEGEADSAVAELAEQTGGLAVSKDSDYFILCSRGAGRARYVPLDSFEYLVEQAAANGEEHGVDEGDDGFEQVSRNRRKKKPAVMSGSSSSRLAALDRPPTRAALDSGAVTLKAIRLRAYSSHALAARLKLPPPLLPLLASVVGNDFSTNKQESLLFRHLQSWADRIPEAAEVIRQEWHSSLGISKRPTTGGQGSGGGLQARIAADRRRAMLMGGAGIDDDSRSETSVASSGTATPAQQLRFSDLDSSPVMDPVRSLVTATLEGLLKRSDAALRNAHYVTEGDKEACIQSIIDGVAAYSLMVAQRGAPNLLALVAAAPEGSEARRRADVDEAMDLYRKAFASLELPPELVGVMAHRSFLAVLAPEDPDVKSVHVGAARDVRRWMYAVLFDVYGMAWAREEMAEPVAEPEVDADEVAEDGRAPLFKAARYKEGESPDDVISVDTESTISAGNGAVIDGEGDDDKLDRLSVAEEDAAPQPVKPPPAVREYVRKGDRLVGELVQIFNLETRLKEAAPPLPASLSSLLGQYAASKGVVANGHGEDGPHVDPPPPLAPLLPQQARLDLYRVALQSGDLQRDAVPLHLLPLAACVRHLIASIAREAGESKRRLNWTRAEVVAAIRTGCQTWRVAKGASEGGSATVLAREHWVAQPSTRGIHLASTLQLMLRTSHDLIRSLLLFPSSSSDLSPPHLLFDGPLFQLLLENDGHATEVMGLSKECKAEAGSVVKAVLKGYEEDLGLDAEELKRLRREAKKARKAANGGVEGGREQQQQGQKQKQANLFDLLDDVD